MDIGPVHRALDDYGEDAILRRVTGSANQVPFDCDVRVHIRVGAASVLVGGVQQTADAVLMTDRETNRNRWPVPPEHGDHLVLRNGTITKVVQGAAQETRLSDGRIYRFTVLGG